MIIKRTTPKPRLIHTGSLAGFDSITKTGKIRRLDQDINRLGRLNTGLELSRETRKLNFGMLKNGGDN